MRVGIPGPAMAWLVAVAVAMAPAAAARWMAPDLNGRALGVERLQTLRPGAVVFIGSSLTECAVPFDGQFSALAAAQGAHFDFVRMTVPNATQEDFSDVLDRIVHSRAGTVLIEAHLLFRQPHPWQRRRDVTHWAHDYMAEVRALRVALGLAGPAPSQNAGEVDCGGLHKSATEADIDRAVGYWRVFRTDPWLPAFRRLVEAGGVPGKRIVVVSIGRSRGLETKVDPDYLRQVASALQRLRTRDKVEVWTFPTDRVPDDYYSDGGHLMVKGRRIFSHWLAGRLAGRHGGN